MNEDLGKKGSEIPEQKFDAIVAFLTENRDSAYKELHSEDEKFTRFLFHANGAGAIAVLGYVGALLKPGAVISWEIPFALFFFSSGVLCCGLSSLLTLESFSHIHSSLCRLIIRWGTDKATLSEVLRPKLRTKFSSFARFFSYASFGLFSLGIVTGLVPNLVRWTIAQF